MNRRELLAKVGATIGLGITPALPDDKAPLPPRIKGVGILRYPSGAVEYEGRLTDAIDVARNLCEQITPGCILCLPSDKDDTGAYLWDFRIESDEPKQVTIERSGTKESA